VPIYPAPVLGMSVSKPITLCGRRRGRKQKTKEWGERVSAIFRSQRSGMF